MPSVAEVTVAIAVSPTAVPIPPVQAALAVAASRELAAGPVRATTRAAASSVLTVHPWVTQLARPVVQPVSTIMTITVASSGSIVDRAFTAAAVATIAMAIDSSLELGRKPMGLAATFEVAADPWAYSRHWAS